MNVKRNLNRKQKQCPRLKTKLYKLLRLLKHKTEISNVDKASQCNLTGGELIFLITNKRV